MSPLAVCFTDANCKLDSNEGAIYRIARDVQRRFFAPPDVDGRMPRVSKWAR
jgi:hypothetical protein